MAGAGRAELDPDDPGSVDVVAQALMLALELATFTASFTGGTAIDRLARQRKSTDGEEKAPLEALRRASFRLLRILSPACEGLVQLEDLATGATVSILDRDIPATLVGLALAARLCPRPDGIFVTVGPLTPLDDTALEVAMAFVRSGKGLTNPQRCAAALYRHVVRHGAPQIPGLNAFPEPEAQSTLFDSEGSELDVLAHAWAKDSSDIEPGPKSPNAARSLTSVQCLFDALVSSIAARRAGKARLADAYSRLASIQMETLQRRATAGFGGEAAPLAFLASAPDRAIAQNRLPGEVRALFDRLRRLVLATVGMGTRSGDADLARVIQRIHSGDARQDGGSGLYRAGGAGLGGQGRRAPR